MGYKEEDLFEVLCAFLVLLALFVLGLYVLHHPEHPIIKAFAEYYHFEPKTFSKITGFLFCGLAAAWTPAFVGSFFDAVWTVFLSLALMCLVAALYIAFCKEYHLK